MSSGCMKRLLIGIPLENTGRDKETEREKKSEGK